MENRRGHAACDPGASPKLSRVRSIELTLAGLISGGALFTAFVTDASSLGPLAYDMPTPRFDASQFAQSEASAGSRAAVAAALARSNPSRRLLPASDHVQEHDGAGGVGIASDVAIRAQGGSSAPDIWSRSAFGVQVTTSARAIADLPPVFLVAGAGRETYMIAPYGPLNYTLAPAGAEASVGDAHIGVGVELNDKTIATVGYVREQRRYSAGARDWSEDEHYVGVALRARW